MSETIFAVAGVIFVAFCIWLAVRIINQRERWAKRTAVALCVPLVAYPLSWGPVWWIKNQLGSSEWLDLAFNIYSLPLAWALDFGPVWVTDLIISYLVLLGIPV